MKILIVFLLCLSSLFASSQTINKVDGSWEYQKFYVYSFHRMPPDTLHGAPVGCMAVKSGIVYIVNSSGVWVVVSGGGAFYDSVLMKSRYSAKQDSISLRTAINGKQTALGFPFTSHGYLNAYNVWSVLSTDSVFEDAAHKYFHNADARAAISLTTIGSSGSATYDNSTGIFNIPNYAGGGGSPGGSTQNIQVNYGGAFTGPSTFKYDSTAKKLLIKNTNSYTHASDVSNAIDITGNYVILGDSTTNEPTGIIIADPYGGALGSPIRAFMGWGGSKEFHMGMNWYYPNQVHTQFDPTEYSNYFSLNPHYFLGQAYGPGKVWNTGKVPWRFDNIESGGNVTGSILTVNGVIIPDPLYSDYDQFGGRYRTKLVTVGGELNISGVTGIGTTDSTNLGIGGTSNSGFRLSVQNTGANDNSLFENYGNNSSDLQRRFLRHKVGGAGYAIGSGIKIYDNINTLCENGWISNSNAPGGFQNFDWYVTTTNSAGVKAERMRLTDSGHLKVNGLIESTTLGFKFPDGSVQTTSAGGGSIYDADGTLSGNRHVSSGGNTLTFDQLQAGSTTLFDANYLIQAFAASATTMVGLNNNDNNTNGNEIRFNKRKSGSYTLTTNTTIGGLDFNTLGRFEARSNATSSGGFSGFDYVWTAPNASIVTAERMRLTGAGDLLLPGLSTSGSAPSTSGTTAMAIVDANGKFSFATMPVSGTFTPTATGTANTSSVTTGPAHYNIIGNEITVFGIVTVTPTLTATSTTISLTQPVLSAFSLTTDLIGTASSPDVAGLGGALSANTGAGTATLKFVSVGTGSITISYSYMYTYSAP